MFKDPLQIQNCENDILNFLNNSDLYNLINLFFSFLDNYLLLFS